MSVQIEHDISELKRMHSVIGENDDEFEEDFFERQSFLDYIEKFDTGPST